MNTNLSDSLYSVDDDKSNKDGNVIKDSKLWEFFERKNGDHKSRDSDCREVVDGGNGKGNITYKTKQ